MTRNFYIILGVDIKADEEEIKTAYRRRVMEFHPDHYGESCDPFLAVQEAYATLSDPEKRRAYNASLQPRPAFKKRNRFSTPITAMDDFHTQQRAVTRTIDTLFHGFNFFEQAPNRMNPIDVDDKKLESITLDVPLSRRQAARGGLYRIIAPIKSPCRFCRGSGSVGFYECMTCGGSGQVIEEIPLSISLPPGISGTYIVKTPLTQSRGHDFYLRIAFRVCADES